MATLSIVSNGYALNPLLPIERKDILIADTRRMLNGQLRRACRAVKKRLRYGDAHLSEAERGTWAAAHPWGWSYSHTDELGVTRTVVTTQFVDTLEESAPIVDGGTSGATFYRVEVEVEEV